MPKKPVIAAFDFDDTLIMRNTLPDFIRFSTTPLHLLNRSFAFLPTLARFALHQINNQEAKERLLTTFIKGLPEKKFADICSRYADRLDRYTNPAGLERLKWHQQRGDKVIIISASAEDWINPWADRHGFDQVIATRLERADGRMTGKLRGKNCHGPEKAHRFLAVFPARNKYTLYVYGDGPSDGAMFDMADKFFKKKFQ